MATWLINGSTPEALGLSLAGGEFRSGSASSVRLEVACDFDEAQIFSYGTAVTITCDAVPFFRGTVRAIPKQGSASAESQSYIIEDAWSDLERTTYQELWKVNNTTSVLTPEAVLGLDAAGTRISTGVQISAALTFAAASGVSLTVGSIPTGMMLWPSKVQGMSCAEVIRQSLRYHPDWVPWIDHSTSPPTFNVTPRATATERVLAVTDCTSLACTRTDDRVPSCVRICYITASQTGDDVFRTVAVDKYPGGGADSGPGILSTIIPLAGVQAQIHKQQIQTRTLPTSQSTAKDYLRKKFPHIKAIADGAFDITEWVVAAEVSDETPPDPINPNATRLIGTSFPTDLPRELVKGSVQEWMRCKVGQVKITCGVTPTSSATAAEIRLLESLPTAPFVVQATNAVTKIYTGLASWMAAEDIPTGVAQAYYETIVAGATYEGSVSLMESEIGATRWHGSKLSLSGGVAEWATMAAPIHRVSWDLETRKVQISFGPNADYSVPDFVEYLRLLSAREPFWMSGTERAAATMGDSAGPSGQGDAAGPFDTPESVIPPNPTEVASGPWMAVLTGDATCQIRNARLITSPTASSLVTITNADTDITLSGTTKIWLKVPFDTSWPAIGSAGASIENGTSWPSTKVTFDSSTPPKQTDAILPIGEVKSGKMPKGRLGFNFKISSTDYHWEQYLTTPLCMFALPINGKAAMFQLPFGG